MFGRECNMPNMGGLMDRRKDKLGQGEGEVLATRAEKTVYEDWEEGLITALDLAWQYTTDRAHRNSARGNKTSRTSGLPFVEYKEGDQCYRKRNRVRVFKSIQEKETYKINVKLQARFEGPYQVVRRVSAVVYEVNIDGVTKRVHATNMKPGAIAPVVMAQATTRATQSEEAPIG
jgi:hypothetical protein